MERCGVGSFDRLCPDRSGDLVTEFASPRSPHPDTVRAGSPGTLRAGSLPATRSFPAAPDSPAGRYQTSTQSWSLSGSCSTTRLARKYILVMGRPPRFMPSTHTSSRGRHAAGDYRPGHPDAPEHRADGVGMVSAVGMSC